MSVVRRRWAATASVVAAIALLGVAFPHVAGTRWRDIGVQLGHLSLRDIGLLTIVWFAGIYVHTFLMTAALPDLSVRQALQMNLAGSAVSNILPFGGAAGVAVGLAMTKSWGFRTSAFALYTLLTNLWNTLAKLALPLLAVLGLALTGDLIGHQLTLAALAGAGLLTVVVIVLCAALVHEATADRLGKVLQRLLSSGARLLRRQQPEIRGGVLELRERTQDLLGRHWPRMSAAMLGYVLLQGLLLWLILNMLGAGLTLPEVFAGFALERFLSLALLTPGGVGIAQTGAAAFLVAIGGPPAQVAAGVLLFSAFVWALEIPVGSAAGAWWWRQSRRTRQAETA